MSYDCYCDGELPEFYSKTMRKARRTHKRWECGGAIQPGTAYEYVSGVWEGSFCVFKTCPLCLNIRNWVGNNLPCYCWSYGNIIADAYDAIDAAYDRASAEVQGLRFGFLRRLAKRNIANGKRANGRPLVKQEFTCHL